MVNSYFFNNNFNENVLDFIRPIFSGYIGEAYSSSQVTIWSTSRTVYKQIPSVGLKYCIFYKS